MLPLNLCLLESQPVRFSLKKRFVPQYHSKVKKNSGLFRLAFSTGGTQHGNPNCNKASTGITRQMGWWQFHSNTARYFRLLLSMNIVSGFHAFKGNCRSCPGVLSGPPNFYYITKITTVPAI